VKLGHDPERQARLEADAHAQWEHIRATILARKHPPDALLAAALRMWWRLMPLEVATYVAARLTGEVRRPRGNPGRSRHAFMSYKGSLSSGGGEPKDGEPTPQGKLALVLARMHNPYDEAGVTYYVERTLARDYDQLLPYIQQLRKKLRGGPKHPQWHPPEIRETITAPASDAATLTVQIVARRYRLVTEDALRVILKRHLRTIRQSTGAPK
jgi:hypothetical protein